MSHSINNLSSSLTENINEVKNLQPETIMEAQRQYKDTPFLEFEVALAESVAMKNGEHTNWALKNAFFSLVNAQDSYWQRKFPMAKMCANDNTFEEYVKLQSKNNLPYLIRKFIDGTKEYYDTYNPIHSLIPIHDYYYKKMRTGEFSVQQVYEGLCEEFSRNRVFNEPYSDSSLTEILYTSFLIQEKYFPGVGERRGMYTAYRAFGGAEKFCITHKDLNEALPTYFKKTYMRALSISIMGWILSDLAEIETEEFILSFIKDFSSRDATYSEDYDADSDFIIIDKKYNQQEIRVSIKSGFRNLKTNTLESLRGRKPAYKKIGLYAGPTTFKVPSANDKNYCSDFLVFGITKNGEVKEFEPKNLEKYIQRFDYDRLGRSQNTYNETYKKYSYKR